MSKRTNNFKNSQRTGGKRGGQRGGKPKETEVDIDSSKINMADVPHVITTAKKDNDESWYTHIYSVVGDFASLPYSQMAGLRMPIDSGFVTDTGVWTENKTGRYLPGVMAFNVYPIAGVSNGPTSPINIAAQQIYTLDRKANSGATNYDKTDVIMLVQGMDSAFMLYETLLRAYRTLGVYNYKNRFLPDVLLAAQGFSPKLVTNLADFRGILDMFAYQLASINVPDQFDFIHRHSWLFTNVYKDSEDAKAQLYLYRPAGFYVWTEGTNNKPTSLVMTDFSELFGLNSALDTVTTLDQIQTAINTVMQPLLGSQDVGTISGDLAKAFGEGGMIKIQPVQSNEALSPVYNMEVIQQMMNAMLANPDVTQVYDSSNLDVTVNLEDLKSGPYVLCKPTILRSAATDVMSMTNRLLNVRVQDPTPGQNLVFTRLMFTLDPSTTSDEDVVIQSCGTELVMNAWIFYPQDADTNLEIVPNAPARALRWDSNYQVLNLKGDSSGLNESELKALIQMQAAIAPFDNHPTLYYFTAMPDMDDGQPNGDTAYSYLGAIQDFDNYVWLNDSVIEQLNTVAVMSEYAVKDYKTGL